MDAARRMITRARTVELGAMPTDRSMSTIDELLVRAPLESIFEIAANVEEWPLHLPHYRYVRMLERDSANGGIVEMAANRPFGPVNWPTWWMSEMQIHPLGASKPPAVRFRHVRGITTGMEVEWSFSPVVDGTHVRILHVWNGPRWPLIGEIAAGTIIGPVFIHGIASRTLAGLARAAAR